MNNNAVTLRTEDAIELAEMLEFLHDWLRTDESPLSQSLARFANGYDIDELRAALTRFAFLLGGDPEQASSTDRNIPDQTP